jgi:arylsulfatase A-like enzyme
MNKLVLTGLLAAGTMTHLQGAQPAGQRPNILFILSDDHTSQAWGIYGGVLAEYAHNANIRRLAKEGVVLDNCFCTNSISAPSRASIRSIQSPEQTVHPCGLTGHLHPHPCHPATSQRIPHRTRRQMAYLVATARIRLLLHLLRSRRIP